MSEAAAPERVVANNFLALGFGEATARGIAFCATVYIARTLGAESYGIVGFAVAVILYLSRLADGGMEFFGLGIREIAEDRDRITTAAPDLVTARIAASAVLAGILLVVGLNLREQPDGMVLGLYGLTLLAVGAGTRWIHLGLESTRVVALSRIAGETTMLVVVLMWVRGPADVVRVPLAQLAGDVLVATLLAWALRRRGYTLPIRVRWPTVWPVFRRAAPLILSALLGLIIYNSDLILLRFFRGASTVGYYAAAYTLISFMINLGGAYMQSLLPTLTRVGAGAGLRVGLYQSAFAQVFAVTLPLAVGGAILAPEIIRVVFGAAYQGPSGMALRILLWSVPIALLREVSLVALVVNGTQAKILRLTALAAVLNLLLNVLLIPRFGIAGAALATGATEIVRLALALGYTRSVGFPLTAPGRLWRPLVAGGAMVAALLLASSNGLWLGIALGAVTYATTLALLGGLRVTLRGRPALTV